jgi:hypothetical protein
MNFQTIVAHTIARRRHVLTQRRAGKVQTRILGAVMYACIVARGIEGRSGAESARTAPARHIPSSGFLISPGVSKTLGIPGDIKTEQGIWMPTQSATCFAKIRRRAGKSQRSENSVR